MNETLKCSYQNCQRDAWRPTEDEKPFCIFYSPKIEEKREEFNDAWTNFLKEFKENIGHTRKLSCNGFIFPVDIEFSNSIFSDCSNYFQMQLSFRQAKFCGSVYFEKI